MKPNILYGHQARKRFGQNFLIDTDIINQIIQSIYPQRDQTLVEIGPGLGALTEPLLATGAPLHVIEIDRNLVNRLQQRFGQAIVVHAEDVLRFDFMRLITPARPLRIIGNLPYNISSPLLFHLLEIADYVHDQHFMLQKEVVERMVATPGHKAYGRLSVMLQMRYYIEHLFDVPAHAFSPAPKVTSAIVRMIPWPAQEMMTRQCDQKIFAKVVALAFSQRRKILRNTLSSIATQINFDALAFDLSRRAEAVPLVEYIKLARALSDTEEQ